MLRPAARRTEVALGEVLERDHGESALGELGGGGLGGGLLLGGRALGGAHGLGLLNALNAVIQRVDLLVNKSQHVAGRRGGEGGLYEMNK